MHDAIFDRTEPPRSHASPFVPVLLIALTLVTWFAFQALQLSREREQLAVVHAAQSTQVESAAKLRAALDAMAASTSRLADGGNVNARLLVEELRKRGVTINTNASAAATR